MKYKELIEKSGYRKNWLAEQIGVSPTMISLFINNQRNISPEKKKKLDSILKVK